MKPDWKDAPEWAKWFAMDCDGEWFWYENKPEVRGGQWRVASGRAAMAMESPKFDARSSLEQRP